MARSLNPRDFPAVQPLAACSKRFPNTSFCRGGRGCDWDQAFGLPPKNASRRLFPTFTHRVDSGVAFSSTQQNVFGYTASSEDTSANMRIGGLSGDENNHTCCCNCPHRNDLFYYIFYSDFNDKK